MPAGITVKVRPGTTLLDAARRAHVPIRTRCGGKAACFMCKVTVEPGSRLLPMGEQERNKLAAGADSCERLSCQARVQGNAVVNVPLDPLRAAVLKKLAQAREDDSLW
ncbi:2Fe-2S iron-sulfur cluster binding domain-containing protein [Paenibacillus protaetiae]|uniref:2Fe-2S iron-sulfur cluster binding domain-containing protein n=2 Tax=Paenibacillus protaetiae TaxID=2509456 RepID=A0A4P6EZS9_9BACL|nr:2Fe-2S iron-sulfur cluster binding domain-containing protein [Paenibacillus protaetiae]